MKDRMHAAAEVEKLDERNTDVSRNLRKCLNGTLTFAGPLFLLNLSNMD